MKKVKVINIEDFEDELTLNKEYEVIEIQGSCTHIINDKGRNFGYYTYRFEEVQELPEKWCVKGTKDKVVQQFFLTYKDNTLDDFVSHPSYENWYFYSEYAPSHYVKHYCSDRLHEEFTEITLQQFKELVLKEQNMNKKIVGYKLLKPYPGLEVGKVYDKHKHQGNTEWFEPQYESTREPKVGDVIYLLKPFDGKEKGHISIVNRITPDDFNGKFWIHTNDGGFRFEGNGYFLDNHFRYATKKEIKEFMQLKVGGYTSEYILGEGVKFGCNYYSKENIQSLLSIMQAKDSSINAVVVHGGHQISINNIKKLLIGIDSKND